ncbi:hypothetical protein GQ54DRAFT_40057 [Martensiomyces pterosporus]|nr:hypothetical protein GQ54DRAFT_40057 [Martensiomyces pterosporus]
MHNMSSSVSLSRSVLSAAGRHTTKRLLPTPTASTTCARHASILAPGQQHQQRQQQQQQRNVRATPTAQCTAGGQRNTAINAPSSQQQQQQIPFASATLGSSSSSTADGCAAPGCLPERQRLGSVCQPGVRLQ